MAECNWPAKRNSRVGKSLGVVRVEARGWLDPARLELFNPASVDMDLASIIGVLIMLWLCEGPKALVEVFEPMFGFFAWPGFLSDILFFRLVSSLED